jgi:hypothetical protein
MKQMRTHLLQQNYTPYSFVFHLDQLDNEMRKFGTNMCCTCACQSNGLNRSWCSLALPQHELRQVIGILLLLKESLLIPYDNR